MPNGHFHDEACDQLVWTYTEQGYPEHRIDRFPYTRALRVLHLRGVRGYAPLPRWETFQPPEYRLPDGAQRSHVEAQAAAYVDALSALLASNPDDPLTPGARGASVAMFWFEQGWVVRIGDYSLYARSGDEPLREIPPPRPSLAADAGYTDEEKARWFELVGNFSTAVGVGGLTWIEPAACVHDLRDVTELLCSTTPLHLAPTWPRIAAAPVFSAESAGLVVEAMRARGVDREADQLTVRWRRP